MPVIVQFDRIGGPENLIFRDVQPREPGPKEVRYKVEAFGLNYGELLWMADRYYNSPELPARIGVEACGIVDAIGPGVTEFTVGDRVSSIPHSDGRYLVAGEWAVTPERYLARWPKEIPAEKACSLSDHGWIQHDRNRRDTDGETARSHCRDHHSHRCETRLPDKFGRRCRNRYR